ncbi:hypothetical protein [Glycomyces tenuis]|uniref:hypothetical protein n=1 Tax=Glycomyces tenuis TaxID=58116 RepID=UPI00047A9808|nr:hypothetical protein [Glycomyces tenuis]
MPISNSVRRWAALGAAAVLALAGCTNDPGGESGAVAEDQAALMELSERLASAETHAYTAEYLVEGTGESVVVAVDPEAGTGAVVVGDRPEFWAGEEEEALSVWLSGKLAAVLPTGEEVSSWLMATSEDPSAMAEFSDTTLAGELADCVKVQGAADSPVGAYEVCVTTVGVVASVTADVEDVAYTVKLVNYHDGVDGAWLDELAEEQ